MKETDKALYNFVLVMKEKLDENKDKGTSWRDMDSGWLFMRLQGEIGELFAELMAKAPDPAKVARECADIANFCMMISDRVRNGSSRNDAETVHVQMEREDTGKGNG